MKLIRQAKRHFLLHFRMPDVCLKESANELVMVVLLGFGTLWDNVGVLLLWNPSRFLGSKIPEIFTQHQNSIKRD